MNLFSGIDLFVGLPRREFHRLARNYPAPMLTREFLTATHYWPLFYRFLFDSNSTIHRSFKSPEGYMNVSFNVMLLTLYVATKK